MSTGTMRLPLHLQATTAETTTTMAASQRGSYVENPGNLENGGSRRGYGGGGSQYREHLDYRQRLPYTARFQKLESQPDLGS
jgi:hypothetical protein